MLFFSGVSPVPVKNVSFMEKEGVPSLPEEDCLGFGRHFRVLSSWRLEVIPAVVDGVLG